MSVNVFDPHAPFDPPQEYRDRYDSSKLPSPLFRQSDLANQLSIPGDFQNEARPPQEFNAQDVIASYYAMIELVDENVGRLLASLEETEQRENTVIIFTSDHGETLGDHGLLTKGCRFYEGSVRVPLIISWPGQFPLQEEPVIEDSPEDDGSGEEEETISEESNDNASADSPAPAGFVSSALVELIDIAPTLLELAGLPIPLRMQGRSLLPILRGELPPDQHRDFVRCEFYRAQNPDVVSRVQYEGSYATMYRDTRHKIVVYHGHEQGELYDLEKDPGEFENLWNDPDYVDLRFDLMRRNFDALAFSVDPGPPQKTPF
jgi:arylsulfatase A-like enzyme